jgi:hypothetical protein
MSNPSPRPPLSQQGRPAQTPRAPILWTGILFALAANLLAVNLAEWVVTAASADVTFETFATFLAPLLVGAATAWYVKRRGGIHAFIGGMLSIPLLAMSTFDGNWQFAVIAGAICGLGGSLTEILMRGRVR